MKKLDFEKYSYVIFLAKKKKKIVGFLFFETQRKKLVFSKKTQKKNEISPKRLREKNKFEKDLEKILEKKSQKNEAKSSQKSEREKCKK